MSQLWAGFGTSTVADTQAAIHAAVRAAKAQLGDRSPGLAVVTATVEHDGRAIFAALRESLPNVPIHGVTTSLGVLTKQGIVTGADGAVAVLLFASSLIAGWAENWFVFHRLDSAIAWNPRIVARLGHTRAQRWSNWWRYNISGVAANVSLGMLLGVVPVVTAFVGLPLEVRHVTLSTGQLAAAAGALGWELLHEAAFWWCMTACRNRARGRRHGSGSGTGGACPTRPFWTSCCKPRRWITLRWIAITVAG